jgi:hypothetical protein
LKPKQKRAPEGPIIVFGKCRWRREWAWHPTLLVGA